jgi:hypothetical protein
MLAHDGRQGTLTSPRTCTAASIIRYIYSSLNFLRADYGSCFTEAHDLPNITRIALTHSPGVGEPRLQTFHNEPGRHFIAAVWQLATRDDLANPCPGLTGARKGLIDRRKRIRFFSGLIAPDHSAKFSDALAKVGDIIHLITRLHGSQRE